MVAVNKPCCVLGGSARFPTLLALLAAIAGCSANPAPLGRSGVVAAPAGAASVTAGNGGNSMPTDIGTISNPGGPIMTTPGSMPAMPPPPPPLPVDPSAAPFVQDDTAMSGLDPNTLNSLKTGSGACAVNVTYPYEGTVFPGGLIPPTIMWDGAAEAASVHFAYQMSDKVDYTFAAKPTAPAQLQIPREAWNEITRRTNNLPLLVTLKTLSGGTVSSCELHWRIAAGNMIGALYYNTYQAPAPGVPDVGAVMRLSLGAQAEIYKQFNGALNVIPGTGPCYSCHSVSFNGRTMVASFHDYSAQTFRVEKFDVGMNLQPDAQGVLNNANFGALTPDGSRILAMGNPQCTAGADSFPRRPNNMPLVEGPDVARLLDTASGMDTNAQGLNKDFYMWMPQFSPDGKKVVFNHAKPDGNGGTDRRELAIMDYDAASNTFSNLKVILSAGKLPGAVTPSLPYAPAPSFAGILSCGVDMCVADGSTDTCIAAGGVPVIGTIPGIPGDVGALQTGSCSGPCYPAWPFFTPDNKGVVFSMVSDPDFAQAFPGRDAPSLSELWYVKLDTLESVRLDAANAGLKDIDKQNNYYPTVMPVAVGGYFWMFWTAVRDYGNKLQGRDPNALQVAASEAIKKRIWAAAILPQNPTTEFGSMPLTDPSYPGFYLDGQSESGNVRAFAALNPCIETGSACSSGLDCCCGYCLQQPGAMQGTCSCEVPKCSKINEKCSKDSDCCPPEKPDDPTPTCIGGFCGFIQVHID